MTFQHGAEPVPSETYPPERGDLLVCTSDNTLLGLHSIIIEVASPVWMEGLNLTPEGVQSLESYVNVPEDRVTFECLLSFIYPSRMPLHLESLDLALSVLRAAVRYKMDRAIQDISRYLFDPSCRNLCLKHLMVADPLRVYAVARELGLEQLAKRSGALTLAADVYVAYLSPEVKKMDTGLYMELLEMRHTREQWLKTVLGEKTIFPIFPVEYQDDQRANGQTLEGATVPFGLYV